MIAELDQIDIGVMAIRLWDAKDEGRSSDIRDYSARTYYSTATWV